MDLARPFLLLTPTVDGDVLSALALAGHVFTPPQLHAIIGRHSVDGVRRALHRLADQGLVNRERIGRADVFGLNRDHLAAPYVIGIAQLRRELLDRMRAELAGWRVPCVYAALFGSAATGTMRHDSDIDVFLVRPDAVDAEHDIWRDQVQHLARTATRWTGNDTRPFELAEEEVGRGLALGEPVLRDIARVGIRLVGPADYLRVSRSTHEDETV